MSDLFNDKSTMDPFDGVRMARPVPDYAMPMTVPTPAMPDTVRTAQTLSEFHRTQLADDAMSTRRVTRPRYGRSV
jgi:hypothetical protein